MRFGTGAPRVVYELTQIVLGGSLPRTIFAICARFFYDPYCPQGDLNYPYLRAMGVKTVFFFILLYFPKNDDYCNNY